jgi:hypothetical protein
MLKKIPFANLAYSAFALNFILAVTLLVIKDYIPPVAPLFYGLPAGRAQLVSSWALLIAPGAGVIIMLINVLFARFSKDLFFKKVLIVSGFCVSLLIAITVIKIIFLVGLF